jgi:hypothetical protein
MAKPDHFLDELCCLPPQSLNSVPHAWRLVSQRLRRLPGGYRKRLSIVSQILPERIRVVFNRIVIRLPPEEVCRSLGFFVAFACGFVHDGIDFALSESFLRFVDNHVFDNSLTFRILFLSTRIPCFFSCLCWISSGPTPSIRKLRYKNRSVSHRF